MQRELTKVVSLSGEPEGQAPPLATQRAAEGDVHALSQIYAQQHQSLRNFARRLLGDPHAAEDLVHDVFVGLPSALARYRGDCSLTTFLRAIAVRQAKTHLRAAVRRRAAMNRLAEELERQGSFAPDELRQRELARALTSALDGLSVAHRTAFVLCEVEELSAEDAAQILDVPAATVRSRLFYARQKLGAQLAEEP